jgi:hypothetical protein
MRRASSWLQIFGRIGQRFQAWRRNHARPNATERRDDLYEIFLFGPHG